jgi:signal peptidase I
MLRFMVKGAARGKPHGWIAGLLLTALLLSGVAMYFVDPFHSRLRDPRARVLGFTIFRQPSLSMAPTVPEGALFLVNVATLRARDPQPGEIIAFLYPPDPSVTYLKRVIAVGGSTIEVRGENVFVDGKKIVEPYLTGVTIYPPSFDREHMIPYEYPDLPPLQIPKGHFFVLGDNRGNSEDSRNWGTVPRELIAGTFGGFIYRPSK